MNPIQSLAEAIRMAKHAVVLTGAGASTDSGLPDFRSKAGLWRGVDPMKLASLTALRRNPVEFYQFYRFRLSKLRGARPNPVHLGLAAMQQAGYIKEIITQNIDGLHQAAGALGVVEMHGNLKICVCLQCHRQFSSDLLEVDVTTEADIPRCPECRGALKPGVVLFEEALPADAFDRAFEAARQADLFIVIGSSLEVGPVNQLPAMSVMEGAHLAIVNLEPTHLDGQAEWIIRERAAQVVENCCRYLGVAIPPVEL